MRPYMPLSAVSVQQEPSGLPAPAMRCKALRGEPVQFVNNTGERVVESGGFSIGHNITQPALIPALSVPALPCVYRGSGIYASEQQP